MVRIGRKSVILFLTCCTLLSVEFLQCGEARALPINRAKRGDLNGSSRNYLEYLYSEFLEVFKASYQQKSSQFAVATINRPENLLPCPRRMNAASSSDNYLAYTPLPSTTRPNGHIHSEISIINNFNSVTSDVNVQSVYLVTHFSPCRYCTDQLRDFVRNNSHVTFYIGYVELYQNEDILNNFIQQVGSEPNVCFGQIKHIQQRNCHDDELKRRSATCPVISYCDGDSGGGGGGCFPPSATVYTRNSSSPVVIKNLQIGDDVLAMNADGQLLYSPIIAFLDRVPSSVINYIQIMTESNHKLLVTASHLMFTNDSIKPLYASDISLGDYIFTLDANNNVKHSKVIQITTKTAIGKYAPLTAEGTIIVDGVLASCYANVIAEQSDIHALFAPLRLLHNFVPAVQGKEGIHWYATSLIFAKEFMKDYLPDALLPRMIVG